MKNLGEKKKAIGLIHKVYLAQLKTSRKYNAFTKTKSEVAGGGRKPWKQKGTGQARAGSIRSPLWVGGGVIFGPKPRIVIKKINKKEKKLAVLSALFLKKSDFIYFEEESLENIIAPAKTKKVQDFLLELGINKKVSTLFILAKPNRLLWLATRNLKSVEISTVSCINIEQLLKANKILLSKHSLELINKAYGKL